jgi:hypothetical protein
MLFFPSLNQLLLYTCAMEISSVYLSNVASGQTVASDPAPAMFVPMVSYASEDI